MLPFAPCSLVLEPYGLGVGACDLLQLGGSWDLVSRVISTLIGVGVHVTITIVTFFITSVTKSHDPLRRVQGPRDLQG